MSLLTGCGRSDGGSDVCTDVGDKSWRQQNDRWGIPNRVEYYESDGDALRDAAHSIAVLVTNSDLSADSNGDFVLADGAKKTTCCAERTECRPYGGQTAFGRCTAFLAAPRTLVTTGHCANRLPCDEMRALFGAYLESPSSSVFPVSGGDVYSCEQVRAKKQNQIFDYAVVRLDRGVKERDPLPLPESGTVGPGDSVGLAGSPGGVPLKLSLPGRVADEEFKEAFLSHELRATTGDSGAPIVAPETGRVEGLHVGEHPPTGATAGLRIGCFRASIPGYSDNDDCNQEEY